LLIYLYHTGKWRICNGKKKKKEEFIHVLIKFYAVLEECMPVEEQKSLWRRLVEWAFPNTISGYSD